MNQKTIYSMSLTSAVSGDLKSNLFRTCMMVSKLLFVARKNLKLRKIHPLSFLNSRQDVLTVKKEFQWESFAQKQKQSLFSIQPQRTNKPQQHSNLSSKCMMPLANMDYASLPSLLMTSVQPSLGMSTPMSLTSKIS